MTIFSHSPAEIVGFVITMLVIIGVVVFVCIKCKKLIIRICIPILAFLVFMFYLFACVIPTIVLGLVLTLFSFMAMMQNPGIFHSYFSNGNNEKTTSTTHSKGIKRIEFYDKFNECIQYLSDHKIGALICLQRNQQIEEYVTQAVKLNSPFSPELVESIFYEGTRLHDGAMIIKDDTIVAANAFLPSTKKTLTGKYGARHRAALGMSEVCDAVMVVVSEETGKISIAYNGVIDLVPNSEFTETLIEILQNA